MVDETQTDHGDESQTTSQEGQTESTPDLSLVVQPFEHDMNFEARASPLTHTSLESEHNQSLIPTLKRKHTEDSSGFDSDSSHSGDDFGSGSESPNSEESTGVESASPSLEAAHPNSPLRILDDILCPSEDQMLFVTLFEWSSNMKLVSDVMASVGRFLTPERCEKEHRSFDQIVNGHYSLFYRPSRNWITREEKKEVQQSFLDSTAENYVRQISVIHRRRCEKLRGAALSTHEGHRMAHGTHYEVGKYTIGGRFMNPKEAFTKARKQIAPPSIVLKPYRPTSVFNNSSSKDNLTKAPQMSEVLETQEPFQTQQPLRRQVNLFSDLSDAEAIGLNGNGYMSGFGKPSADLEHSSGFGQKPGMPELHDTEGLVSSPLVQRDVSFNGTSLMPLSPDYSFDNGSILHCLEDLPDTLQFQQLQLNDTEYLEQGEEPNSDHSSDHSMKDSRRELSQETSDSSYRALRGSRKRMKRDL